MKNIAVFCGSSLGSNKNIIKQAKHVGASLVKNNLGLVYGGSKIGLMGTVADEVLGSGGEALGIIPEFLKTKEIVHEGLTELIVTKNMHDRKVMMYERSDGFIIIPGGFGTMDEFFEITTWGQLGLHSKPIGILNSSDYYSFLIMQFDRMVSEGFLTKESLNAVIVSDSIEDLLEEMKDFKPLPKPNWLNLERI